MEGYDLISPVVKASSFVLCGGIAGIYYLFHKQKLPRSIAQFVGKIYFWPTFPFLVLGAKFRGQGQWWNLVDDYVYLGAAPFDFLGHISELKRLGVKGIVNLCDEYLGPEEKYKALEIDQLWLPTIDHFEPSIEDMKKAVIFIEKKVSLKQAVYVHCRAGHGRSAAVLMCWLMYYKKMKPEEAQRYLSSIRPVRKTLYKQKGVKEFYEFLKSSPTLDKVLS